MAAGGTCNHFPRGENGRLQDGPAALIDDPQPADPPARTEGDELLGIHLPDVVGPSGAGDVGRGPAALGGRAEAGLVEPALQGAFRGYLRPGVWAAPEDPDQPRPPGRVLAAEGQRLVAEALGSRGAGAAAAAVRRGEGVGPVATAVVQELADGARGQP
ncbi:MAG: hypothetical protein ACREN5_04355, partial [Gemmatimonadales bacterium]